MSEKESIEKRLAYLKELIKSGYSVRKALKGFPKVNAFED